MPLVVTSAAGANGDGYGALLAFDDDGRPLGPFTRDARIADPRGLGVSRNDGLLFVNSGTDRVPAIDRDGVVVRDSGPIDGLNPGGGNFGPDGRYYVGLRSARTIMALAPGLDGRDDHMGAGSPGALARSGEIRLARAAASPMNAIQSPRGSLTWADAVTAPTPHRAKCRWTTRIFRSVGPAIRGRLRIRVKSGHKGIAGEIASWQQCLAIQSNSLTRLGTGSDADSSPVSGNRPADSRKECAQFQWDSA